MVDPAKSRDRTPLRIGWFTTANGPGSRGMFEAVLEAIKSNRLNATFEFVFVNRERGQTNPTDSFLDLVEADCIPTITFSSLDFRRQRENAPWAQLRGPFDRAVLTKLKPFKPDISVMAGYMLFAPKISRHMLVINQHPALPGGTIGKWQDAIWDVIENRDDHHGSMIHIATPELDRGPVLTTCRFSTRGPGFDNLWQGIAEHDLGQLRDSGDESQPLFVAIRKAGVQREQPLVVETLRAIADGDIAPTAYAEGSHTAPVDMTAQVEAAISRNRT